MHADNLPSSTSHPLVCVPGCCHVDRTTSLYPSSRAHPASYLNCLGLCFLYSCFCRVKINGAWSEEIVASTNTTASGNRALHSILSTPLSSLSFTKSSPSRPFLHVYLSPEKPRSNKLQKSRAFWKACIRLLFLAVPPHFSVLLVTSLKSPIQSHGEGVNPAKYLNNAHASCLFCGLGWP